MNKAKKVLRVALFVLLILLAGLGIGLTGGVPLPQIRINRDPEKDKTELVETANSNKSDMKELS